MTSSNSSKKTLAVAPRRRAKGRPTNAEAVQLRQQFLAIALEVFLEKGYAGSSMEGIARRAKVSKNTVYLQFNNKDELFRAAAQHGLSAVDFQVDVSVNKAASMEVVLLDIIKSIQLMAAKPSLRNLSRLLIAESQRFPTVAVAMLAEFNAMIEPISRFIESTGLPVRDPAAAASDLVMLALGGFSFLLAEPETSTSKLNRRALEVRDQLLTGWRGA
ncbi:MAG: TetR/AcrR family transcriptional regulator [Spongiibacteraceae bacterium]|jgi:AcrR family transcriptional regulator